MFRGSSAGVLTEYRGLTVAQLKELRRSLGDNATYAVVKNTLTSIAAKEAGVDAFDGPLPGPSAIAFITGDPVEAAKGLRDFARTNPQLVIKGGYLEGKTLTPAEITRLADLESREVLLAKLAGAMKASLNNAAYLFAAPLRRPPARSTRCGSRSSRRVRRPRPGPAAEDAPASEEAPAAEAATEDAPPRPRPPRADQPGPRWAARRTVPTQRKDATMAKLSTDELLDAFKDMTLIELSEFVKKFEETFEVTAAAPVAVAAAGGAGRPRRRGRGGEGRVRRHPRGRGRQEDPGHQGGPHLTSLGLKEAKDHRGRRPQADPRAGEQGRRGEGQGRPRGRRRHRHREVTPAGTAARAV